jgi:hypothetical protein
MIKLPLCHGPNARCATRWRGGRSIVSPRGISDRGGCRRGGYWCGGAYAYDTSAVFEKKISGDWRSSGDTPLDNACNAERNQYRLFTWLLVGGGVVLTAGGALVVRAKAEGK